MSCSWIVESKVSVDIVRFKMHNFRRQYRRYPSNYCPIQFSISTHLLYFGNWTEYGLGESDQRIFVVALLDFRIEKTWKKSWESKWSWFYDKYFHLCQSYFKFFYFFLRLIKCHYCWHPLKSETSSAWIWNRIVIENDVLEDWQNISAISHCKLV